MRDMGEVEKGERFLGLLAQRAVVIERRATDGTWERIVTDPVEAPSFLDEDVRIGQPIAYRVVAVDRATPANESEPTEMVEIQLVAEPVAPGNR